MSKFKDVELKSDERVDDLETHNLFLLQKKDGYCFSSDAVLLANFVKVKKSNVVVDLCSGSGIVGIIVSGKQKPKKVYLVEIQEEISEMSNRSIQICGLQENVESICTRLQDLNKNFISGSIDVVTVNPPYSKLEIGKLPVNHSIAVSRHEIEVNFEEIAKESARLLKFGGEMYLVHQTDRLSEVLSTLEKYNITPKELSFVFPGKKMSNVFLLRGKKGAKPGLVVNQPVSN